MKTPAAPAGPLWLLAELTYACPLQCPYCSNPVALGRRREELDARTWIRVMGEARALGAVQLGFSGGEPCLRPDLEELVAEGRRLGYYTNLITSAVGLDEGRIERLRGLGLDHIQISFQAAEARLNDRVAGTECFAHKLRMARAVKAAGYPMVLNFVLYRENLSQIGAILELAASLGADQVELANTQYYGWALENRARLLPSRAELEAAKAEVEAFRTARPAGPRYIFVTPDYYSERPKACMNGWGTTFLSIAPDGTALPCQAAAIIPGLDFPNVRDRPVAEIWRDSEAFNRFRGDAWMRPPCRGCPERERDFGGCRCQAYVLTGDAASTDPVCTLSSDRPVIDAAIEEAAASARLDRRRRNEDYLFRNPANSRRLVE